MMLYEEVYSPRVIIVIAVDKVKHNFRRKDDSRKW